MQTITSKEVAEMLGKRHDNLLRDIRKYIATLGEDADNYFTEDPIKGAKMYSVSKIGCDLMAGRIIGEKSEAFKAKYLPVFGEVETSTEVEKAIEPEVKEYTVEEVAQILGVSERSIYNWVKQGKLGSVQREIMIPTTKTFVTEEDLKAYKTERGIK